MKKLTNKEIIEKFKKVHGDKYDYSLVDYITSTIKVKILCPIHGLFIQKPNNHLNNNGCPICGKENRSKKLSHSNKIFIEKSKKVHDDKYDYSLVEYKNSNTHIYIICKKHNRFKQLPLNHLRGQGCPYCYGNNRKTTEQFIKESKEIHNNKYDYSLVDYKNSNINVKIICPIHGVFEQTPTNHISNKGCPKCAHFKTQERCRKNINIFISESINIHNNKYDYSLVKYKTNNTNIKIICPIHGIFEQKPKHHLNGSGCPKCNESKGELEIRKILENNNIKYISEKRFKKCKNIKTLPFDFFLPDYNLCIEFDGKQHYKSINHFGGLKEFKNIQKRDQIKNKYCIDNNIKLIRIKYNKNIKNVLIQEKIIK